MAVREGSWPRSTGRLGAIAVLAVVAGVAPASDFGVDPSIDSNIELVLETQGYEHRRIDITISTELGVTNLKLERDGVAEAASMPFDDCAPLWDFVLRQNVHELGDAMPESLLPDLATFTFTFRDGLTTHTFSAYGVEFITDTRYRDLARTITDFAEKHLSQASHPEDAPAEKPDVDRSRRRHER
jgi:hypothetical protein